MSARGCIRRGDGDASQVEVLRSGELSSAGGDEDIADVAYVNVRDKSNRVFGLHSLAETYLSSKGFTVTDNPSQAGYIIQITVLDAGPVDPDSLRRVVDAGYDAPSKLSGHRRARALLTDVLLVQRRVPNARRPNKANLKNISSRNAVASSRMRLALLVRREITLKGLSCPRILRKFWPASWAQRSEPRVTARNRPALPRRADAFRAILLFRLPRCTTGQPF